MEICYSFTKNAMKETFPLDVFLLHFNALLVLYCTSNSFFISNAMRRVVFVGGDGAGDAGGLLADHILGPITNQKCVPTERNKRQLIFHKHEFGIAVGRARSQKQNKKTKQRIKQR